jgi:hypothetical protein
MDICGNMDIGGNTDISGNIFVAGTASVNNKSSFIGNVAIGRSTISTSTNALDVSGNMDICGNIAVEGTARVNNKSSFIGNVAIGRSTISTSTNALDVSGNMDICGNMEIGGNTDISGYATIKNYAYLATTSSGTNSNYVKIGNPTITSAADGNLYVAGNAYANAFFATSDYRIKENPQNLNSLFYNVDNLRPVIYKNKQSQKPDIGLIAHELQEQYPFLVNGEKDGEKYQSINYNGLIGILIKEIKDLKEEMKIVKAELAKK